MSASDPKRFLSASELMAKLQQDPDYVSRIREAEQRQQEFAQEHNLAAAPIVNELKNAGFFVESIDELRRSGIPYTAAIPVLLKWLPLTENVGVKESIVRALSVPWAKPIAAEPLLAEFRAAPSVTIPGLKWAIANALEVVADDSVLDEISNLVRAREHGKAREMLALALGNMKNPAAVDVLIKLLNDDEVAGHALMGLGKLKAQKARPDIEKFLDHPTQWIRKEARKTLAKLTK
jgi:HEAT repeat protein